MAVITGDKAFAMGGAGVATDTTFSNPVATGKDIAFNPDGTIGTPIQSAASDLPAARCLGGLAVGAGFIYFVAGSSTGSDATDTVFSTF
jgi:hypothetical protein